MNVIFLTIGRITDISTRGIYTDLMRKFRDEGHNVYIVYPLERKFGLSTSLKKVDGISLLGIRTLNIQKTNFIEKGIGTILLEIQFNSAVNNYLRDINFDLILYSTPPITFTNVIKNLKKNNPRAISYLLLKDIFPQNAVDLGMFSEKSLFYNFFRKKEVDLYKNSDFIGCMSPANVIFLLKHNPYINSSVVEVAPNSVELQREIKIVDRVKIREKYSLPINKSIFIYGGNLGKPQGIDFLIKCLDSNKDREDCFFLVIGDGTEYNKLNQWFINNSPKAMSIYKGLPKEEYDMLVQACDVGLIFLDHRFTIPNYPSRLLSYLEYAMPIIAATDKNTDIGTIASNNGYGLFCESNNVEEFTKCVNLFLEDKAIMKEMGQRGYDFLINNYLVDHTYNKIISHIK